ncbi:MAG: alanine racemase [Spirochaetaceae bacterium]|nr:alanine racemase [Spirochaetaceae bacterium]
MRATQAHINLDNLHENINIIKKYIKPGTKLCCAVKADGYGHGAVRVSVAALKAGASFLAVASISEGIELREAGIVAPILSLSLPLKDEIPSLIVHSITPLIFDTEFIDQLNEVAISMHRKIPVHLKIDTGMGRVGCSKEEAATLAKKIAFTEGLYLEGVCTHLACADSLLEDDIAYTKKQISNFSYAVEQIKKEGINPGILHCSNSGAIFLHPEAHFDMVRPGIVIYGYSSCAKEMGIELKPVMEFSSQIVAIKHFKKGDSVSYDRTWVAKEDCDIGVIPAGYADGLLRRLSPGLEVSINGRMYPIVGRICMDQCMVYLGKDYDVKRWDKVIFFGPEKNCNTAEDLANSIETISYEILCGVNKRVPRIYVDTDKNK